MRGRVGIGGSRGDRGILSRKKTWREERRGEERRGEESGPGRRGGEGAGAGGAAGVVGGTERKLLEGPSYVWVGPPPCTGSSISSEN
ncbi:hypothetical protein GUJ93_ZPchr0006g46417 [Zizania palustris]|uniref:Uncharacterized protein n=1 Tax=Zizania palustris TaxID=103762 RepID=A0A8J5VVZ4_ZIZPA|nr:hypothetical protein GUJ93_ZPchr0006g46417 [Zizania palustris]